MRNKHITLRGLLWFICAYHIVIGFAANLPPPQASTVAMALLGLHLPDDPALFQVLKPFGIYAMTFGVMMGVAAWNPVKNRALITIGVVLFGLRLLQRLTNLDAVEHSLGVTAARNWATIGTVSCFTLLLAWLRWRLYHEMHDSNSTPAD